MPLSRNKGVNSFRTFQAVAPVLGLALAACAELPVCHAQALTPIRIDASQPFTEPAPAHFDEGSATSPAGSTLGLNSRYLTRDGQPWLPVMGEFHFSRYPRAQWEEEILKMKASGVNIIATYVIWIHHEEVEDQFDWAGQRDLRAFIQLCQAHGMYVLPRIGPWAHGEVRNGGFPDWVAARSPTRVNNPVYLAEVRSWYGQIAKQLNGLLWKDGGPIIGIQLENEYSQRGPGAGEEHIRELKKLAIASGIDVPFYFVTGWDNAVVPAGAVLPLFGGYPAAPWSGSTDKLKPQEVYAFRFHSRVASNLPAGQVQEWPFLTAEIGGGNQVTYHRRPVIAPDDIAAMFPVMLGSGVNLYGTYMFQGGENPDGKLSTLEESQATGYPNDVPVKSYDFQAPLSEFGQERASLRKIKVYQYFLNDFGADLAAMVVHAPDALPAGVDDFSVPRASVRSRGDQGFIFFNNYVRGYAMPARPAVQFEIHLPSGTLLAPRRPVDIPAGSYFIWPFNLRVGGVRMQSSTAQLFTRLETEGETTLYFAAVPGIPAELVFDAAGIRSVHASSGETETSSGTIAISGVKPGIDSSIDVALEDGKALHCVVLTAEEAEDAWKARIGRSDHLLITAQDFFADPDSRSQRIWLQSTGTPDFAFIVMPPPATAPLASFPLTETAATAHMVQFTAQAAARHFDLKPVPIQSASPMPPAKDGAATSWRKGPVALAPSESEFSKAARWSLYLPPGSMDHLSNLFLKVDYQGDVARLSAKGKLLDDDFYNGHPWVVGLSRFLSPQGAGTFELSILPLRRDSTVYFELPEAISFPSNGQIDKLNGLTLVPQYQLLLSTPVAASSAAETK
jgi:beta-galactosidase